MKMSERTRQKGKKEKKKKKKDVILCSLKSPNGRAFNSLADMKLQIALNYGCRDVANTNVAHRGEI